MADENETKGGAEGKGAEGSGNGKPGEERRQRDRRQRPPVTIDLTAENVRAKPAAAEPAAKPEGASPPEPPRPPQPERPAASAPPPRNATPRAFGSMDDAWTRSAIAGVAGGIIALFLVIVLQAIGILPAPGRSAANQAAEQAQAASDATLALERRLTAIEAMTEGLPAMRSEAKNLTERTAAIESSRGTLATHGDVEAVVSALSALRQRVDAAPTAASRDDLDAVSERIGRLEVSVAAGGGTGAGSEAAVTSLSTKLSETETSLRSLTERLVAAEVKMASLGTAGPMTGGEAAVKALAITALRRAAEGNEPFTTEVDMVSALGIAGDDVAKLRPGAATGVPGAAEIVAGFPAVADAILSATAQSDPNAGILQRIVGGLSGLVSIRPAGPVAGDDPPAIVSRMTAAVANGDLAAALAEREALPQAGKDASAEWAAKAADRAALDAVVERIARSLDSPAG